MKIIIKIVGFAAMALVVLLGGAAFKIYSDVGSLEYSEVKAFYLDKARNLSQEEKELIKNTAQDAKYKIYEEATEHNPEGDVLPDEIDDRVKDRIKQEIREN